MLIPKHKPESKIGFIIEFNVLKDPNIKSLLEDQFLKKA